jgi:hypothetical protein
LSYLMLKCNDHKALICIYHIILKEYSEHERNIIIIIILQVSLIIILNN